MTVDANGMTPSNSDVDTFIASVAGDRRRRDAEALVELMSAVTGQPPTMWGTSIVGFGSRHYRYASGREADTVAVGFSPRKAQAVLYLTGGVEEYEDLLARLGPHRTGKSCLYLTRVDQVDPAALREIVDRSYRAATVD